MYTLYTIPGSCSTAITTLLKKLDLEFQLILRDSEENYSKIVPTNQVPALQENDNVFTEGAAIALSLLEKHANNLIPKDELEKAEFYRWLMFMYATLHPAYSRLFFLMGAFSDAAENKQEIMQKAADGISKYLSIIESKLQKDGRLVDTEIGIVDYLLAVYVSWNDYFPQLQIDVGPETSKYIKIIKEQPEYQSAIKAESELLEKD